jgi:hypothetical protein
MAVCVSDLKVSRFLNMPGCDWDLATRLGNLTDKRLPEAFDELGFGSVSVDVHTGQSQPATQLHGCFIDKQQTSLNRISGGPPVAFRIETIHLRIFITLSYLLPALTIPWNLIALLGRLFHVRNGD